MKIKKLVFQSQKWLKRLALAYMLGFANAMNQETKHIEDNFFKTEQKQEKPD